MSFPLTFPAGEFRIDVDLDIIINDNFTEFFREAVGLLIDTVDPLIESDRELVLTIIDDDCKSFSYRVAI